MSSLFRVSRAFAAIYEHYETWEVSGLEVSQLPAEAPPDDCRQGGLSQMKRSNCAAYFLIGAFGMPATMTAAIRLAQRLATIGSM